MLIGFFFIKSENDTLCTYDDNHWYIHSHNNLPGKNTYIPHLEDHMRSLLCSHMIHKDFLSDQVPSLARTDLKKLNETNKIKTMVTHLRHLLLPVNQRSTLLVTETKFVYLTPRKYEKEKKFDVNICIKTSNIIIQNSLAFT